MMVCEEDVVNWFQGLKGHQRIPILRQLVHMCHPLELRFIASCVEDACRTDCLTMRSAELNANTQNVLKSLASPLDVEARSKIIVYLCLLNSTNKLCSRILSQKICDHESVTQFCDDVHKQLMAGELPSSEEQRTLDELRLLYLLASLHPSFDFIERQHYREMCSSLNDMESELKKIERKEEQKQVESVVPKPCCDGGSQRDNASKSCSLCFSTSAHEHICKLRLLPRCGRQQDGDNENQVNVQWSTGKYSNLVIRDTQLRQLHARLETPQLEEIISQPRLPPFPHDPAEAGQLNSYLQHLQGLAAVTYPRSEPVYQFFRQLADEQEQRGRSTGASRPHSVYRPRAADGPGPPGRHPVTNGLPPAGPSETTHKLTMPLQNGTAEADDSSETSPAVLDEDAEVKSCTIYNSNITNGRAGSRSPLPISRLAPACSASPERPEAGWSPRAASHSPGPGLTNGVVRTRPPAENERLHQLLAADNILTKHADRLLPHTLSQLRSFSDEQLQEYGLPDNALRRLRAVIEEAVGAGGSRGSSGPTNRRRPTRQPSSRSGSVDKEEALRAASTVSSTPTAGASTTGTARDRPTNATVVSPRTAVGSTAPPVYSAPAPVPVPPPGAVPEAAVPGAPSLQTRIICSQTAGMMPAPAVPQVVAACCHAHTMPTYSAVTAHNATTAPGALVDGVRCAVPDGPQLVFTGHSTGSPPPAGLVSGYRPPPRSVNDLLRAGSSPSPPAPAGSPAATLPPPPPPPHTLASFLPSFSRPPPLPQAPMQLSMVYQAAGGGFVHGFPHEMQTFFRQPFALQYAPVPPPRAAPQPPPPSRPLSCYNCGQGHLGRGCPHDNAMNDASQQNQFKMSYVSSISEN